MSFNPYTPARKVFQWRVFESQKPSPHIKEALLLKTLRNSP